MRRPLPVPFQILVSANLPDIDGKVFENLSLITRQFPELFQLPYKKSDRA